MKNSLIFFSIFLFLFLSEGCTTDRLIRPKNLLSDNRPQEALDSIESMDRDFILSNPEAFYLKAKSLYRLEKYDEALKNINQAIDFSTKDPLYYILKGKILYGAKKYLSAIYALNNSQQFSTKFLDAYLYLGLSYTKLNESEEAKKHLSRLLNLSPFHLAGNIAFIEVSLKDTDSHSKTRQYLNQLQKSLRGDPQNFEGNLLLAKLYLSTGDTFLTISTVEKWIKKNGSRPEMLEPAGQAYSHDGRFLEAEEFLSQYEEGTPSPSLLYFRAQNLLNLGRQEEAKKILESPLLAKNDFYRQLLLARIRIINLQPKEALLLLNETDENHPKVVEVHYLRAFAYYRLFEYSEAQIQIDKAIAIDPNDIRFILAKAQIFMVKGAYELARTFLENRKFENRPREVEQLLGDIYLKLFDYQKARSHYKKAEQGFSDPKIASKLVLTDVLSGKLREAEESMKVLLQAYPENYDVLRIQSQILFLREEDDKMLDILNRLKSYPQERGISYLLAGNIYFKRGETELGFIEFETGASRFPRNLDLLSAFVKRLGEEELYNRAIPFLNILISFSQERKDFFLLLLAEYYEKTGNVKSRDLTMKEYYRLINSNSWVE